MGSPIFKLSGRSRIRRPWWAAWRRVEEFEVYVVFWSSRFFWYTRGQMRRHLPQLVNQLPE